MRKKEKMTMDKCFYCQEESHVEAFRNPYTKEIHPTCEQCIKEFTSYAKETSFYTKAGCIWIPLLILGTVILMFFNWKWGLSSLVICMIIEIISIKLQGHYVKKKQIDCGTYVDPKSIHWCKTCKHYKKVKRFDDTIDGIWRNEKLPDNNSIPCRIIDETINVWNNFFSLDTDKRTLYPKDCSKWFGR
ncbi:MAG: hypothetical protein KKH20_10130 [Proteobacteria bacterium]|nr:hypothetical protein [Pseudomonadota bacterium]MBU4101712.1 hypothetical protein [Pseudomonadota bacterium]